MSTNNDLIAEMKCEICGRVFAFCGVDRYAWKITYRGQRHYFCRYRCYREFEKRKASRKNQGKVDRELQREIIRMLKDGRPAKEICKAKRVSVQRVNYYRRRLEA